MSTTSDGVVGPEQQESQKRPALPDDLTRRLMCFWRKEETQLPCTNGGVGGPGQEQESQTRPAFLSDYLFRRVVCFWRKEEEVKIPGKATAPQTPKTEFDKILAEYEKDLKKDVAEQADAANKQKYTTTGNIFGFVLSPSKMKNSTKATSTTNDPSIASAQPINNDSVTASSSSASTKKQQKSRRRGIKKTGRSSKNASTSVSTAPGGGEVHDEIKFVDDIANDSRRSESETTTTSTDEPECSFAGRSDENKSTTCTSSWWRKVLLFLGVFTGLLTPVSPVTITSCFSSLIACHSNLLCLFFM